jgi:NhaP-type Na+/H+ or K+/H+ antiporter
MNEQQQRRKDYLHYSSAGIQMVLTILLFTWIGTRLDKSAENEKPIWTAILAIFGVVVAMVFMLRAFSNPPSRKKDKDKPQDPEKKNDQGTQQGQ